MPLNYQYEFGNQVLGPIFRLYCYRLRLLERYKKGVPFLFLSRGGLRLSYLYNLYLTANNLQPVSTYEDFYVSRLAALRALLAKQSTFAANEIAREYNGLSLKDAMRCFLPANVFDQWITRNSMDVETNISPSLLLEISSSSQPRESVISTHILEQLELLKLHFNEISSANTEVVLVDTGWSGSIIGALQALFTEIEMTAAFIGRFNYGRPQPPWYFSIMGLVTQSEVFSYSRPLSAILFHRHLIESTLEPRWPSVEYYQHINGAVEPASGLIPDELRSPGENEFFFKGVCEFIANNPMRNLEVASLEHELASQTLRRVLTTPTRNEAIALGEPSRSADFGRPFSVPILLSKSDDKNLISRLRKTLWKQGQIAIEFNVFRLPLQFFFTWRNSIKYGLNRLKANARWKVLEGNPRENVRL